MLKNWHNSIVFLSCKKMAVEVRLTDHEVNKCLNISNIPWNFIFYKFLLSHFIWHFLLHVPYSPNGKRNIRDPFKENIDSSRTVAMIQRGPWSWTNSIIFITIVESRIRHAQWANVFYKPTCTKYLGRIKFALKINANVVIFIACGIW